MTQITDILRAWVHTLWTPLMFWLGFMAGALTLAVWLTIGGMCR